jgi:hypothetical protein
LLDFYKYHWALKSIDKNFVKYVKKLDIYIILIEFYIFIWVSII